jgi:PAS domain S-box-containing protein
MKDSTATELAGWNVEAQPFLKLILDGVAQPVWVVDHDGFIRYANPAALRALGYDDLSELEGRPSHETIHYRYPDGSDFPVEDCPMLLPRKTGETIHSDEDWFFRRDGTMFPVSYWSAPIDTPQGRGAVVAFTDIEEQREIEQVLRERDTILETVAQPVFVTDQEGLIRYANPAAVAALGFGDLSELVGQSGHWLVHYKRPDGSPFPIEECQFTRPRRLDEPSQVGEDWFVRKDGSMVPLAYTASPIAAPAGVGMVIAFTDVRERREAERAARERDVAEARAAEARAAQRRTIEAADAARRQVTRDLHDGAQQQFVNVVINLQLVQQKWTSEPDRARQLLDAATQRAKAGIDELRELAAGIHPSLLTTRGLLAAVEALADRMPIPVEPLDIPTDRYPPAIEASVYFLVSEALTNVVKHARATRAGVRIAAASGRLTVEVSDDGVGGADLRSPGHGLAGLSDRVAALEGTFSVRSEPAAGTTLRAEVPLPKLDVSP